ncbi:hypothetical protein [Cellulomonas sp.]|uniref:hypothetical protein n=1 Tax=Cellulomonas sp. TaxID=40001 RepID=UPI003BA9CAFD
MTVQGASGRTWLLRALLAAGGGLLVALLTGTSAHAAEPESGLGSLVAASAGVVAPAVDVVSVVTAPVAPVLPAVAETVAPAVAVVAPVTSALAPVTTALQQVNTALTPVRTALEPLRTALEPVTTALEPVVKAVDPVTSGLRPATDPLLPVDVIAPRSDVLGPDVQAPVDRAVRLSEFAPEDRSATHGPRASGPDVVSTAEAAPVRAPHRQQPSPGGEGAGLPASGSASPGAARGGVDGDIPVAAAPPALGGSTTRAGPSPAPLPAPCPEVPDSPA